MAKKQISNATVIKARVVLSRQREKHFFTVRAIKPWKNLPREAMQFHSGRISRPDWIRPWATWSEHIADPALHLLKSLPEWIKLGSYNPFSHSNIDLQDLSQLTSPSTIWCTFYYVNAGHLPDTLSSHKGAISLFYLHRSKSLDKAHLKKKECCLSKFNVITSFLIIIIKKICFKNRIILHEKQFKH